MSLAWQSEVAPRCVTEWGTGCFIQAMSNDRHRKSCRGAGVLRMEWLEAECAVLRPQETGRCGGGAGPRFRVPDAEARE